MICRRLFSSHRIASVLLSLLVLAVALITLLMGYWFEKVTAETVTVREIALLMSPPSPPPPPPPAMRQPVVESPVTLQIQGSGPSLQMLEIMQPLIEITRPRVFVDTSKTQWQPLEVNWDAFALNDLDALPTLLTPLRAVFPKSLTRRGIHSALVKLDVLIDERGQVTLVDVVENPYPELNSEIQKIVRNSRFTAPRKNNTTVRARFIWPIDIKS